MFKGYLTGAPIYILDEYSRRTIKTSLRESELEDYEITIIIKVKEKEVLNATFINLVNFEYFAELKDISKLGDENRTYDTTGILSMNISGERKDASEKPSKLEIHKVETIEGKGEIKR